MSGYEMIKINPLSIIWRRFNYFDIEIKYCENVDVKIPCNTLT